MCNQSWSESGQLCSIDGCEEYRRILDNQTTLQDDRDKLLAENAALRQERDRLAGIVEKADMLAREVKTGAKREWVAYQKYQEARRGR